MRYFFRSIHVLLLFKGEKKNFLTNFFINYIKIHNFDIHTRFQMHELVNL